MTALIMGGTAAVVLLIGAMLLAVAVLFFGATAFVLAIEIVVLPLRLAWALALLIGSVPRGFRWLLLMSRNAIYRMPMQDHPNAGQIDRPAPSTPEYLLWANREGPFSD